MPATQGLQGPDNDAAVRNQSDPVGVTLSAGCNEQVCIERAPRGMVWIHDSQHQCLSPHANDDVSDNNVLSHPQEHESEPQLIPPEELCDFRENEIKVLMRSGNYNTILDIGLRLIDGLVHYADPRAVFTEHKDMNAETYRCEVLFAALLCFSLLEGKGPPRKPEDSDAVRHKIEDAPMNDDEANVLATSWVLAPGM